MNYKSFLAYNVIGGLLWAVGILYLGYFLGQTIPNIDHYLWPIIGGIIFITLLPNIIPLLRDKEMRKKILFKIKSLFN